MAAQVASQLTSLLVIAILYRLVDPEAFGLLGMLAPWVMLLRLLTTQGLGVATIQHPSLSDGQLNSLYWLNILLGFATAVAIGLGSLGMSWLYGAAAVIPVGWALAPTALLAAAANPHQALLERKLEFRRVTGLRIVAQLIGGIAAVAAAWLCWQQNVSGVWALVVQQYVELLGLCVGGWWLEAWRPSWPRVRWRSQPKQVENLPDHEPAKPDATDLRELLQFGGFYGAANLVFFLSRNIDKIALALLFGSSPAGRVVIGLYTQAFNQMMKPVQLVTTPLSGILLPILSRTQDEPREYEQWVVRFFRLAAMGLAPAAVGLWVVAVDGFLLLGGSDWQSAGELLQLFSAVIFAQGLINLCGSVLASRGMARLLFWAACGMASLLLITVALTAWSTSLWQLDATSTGRAVALAFTLTVVLAMPPYVAICMSWGKVGRQRLAGALAKPLGAALWMGAITWMLREILSRTELPAGWRVGLVILAGVLFYSWIARDLLAAAYRDLLQPDSSPTNSVTK